MRDDGDESQGQAAPGQRGEHGFGARILVRAAAADRVADGEIDEDQPDDDGPDEVDAPEAHLKQARGAKLGGEGGHARGEDGECNVSFHGWNGGIIP